MADLKVNDGGTVKTPERIFVVGASNTLFQVNYVIANNASQTPVTVWDAIFTTSRTTSFTTSTSFTTTFATTRDTTQTTTTSFATGFDTSQSTSASTTTSFNTSQATTTTFSTSKNTTTTFSTSQTTTGTTLGAYTAYQYSYPSNYFWAVSISVSIRWNGTLLTSGFVAPGTSDTTWDYNGYRYNRGTLQQSVASKLFTTYYYSIRRRNLSQSTSFTTSFNTTRTTVEYFNTSRSTTTTFGTSGSTTTTFDTAVGTSDTTTADTTTTFSTSFDTTNTTSQDTTTSNATTVFERVTATGAETEVSSAGAHNIRHWDGSQWTES